MSTDIPKVTVPEGRSGLWAVERFVITKDGAELANLQMLFSGMGARSVRPGSYTRLMRYRSEDSKQGTVVMSDTPAEIGDHRYAVWMARGSVLVHGLGLGVVLQACAMKEQVEHVTVVENSPDVIKLVWPHYDAMFGSKIDLIEDDALTWRPPKGARWDVVWHDIWDYISADNLPEMHRLHRRFGRRAGWQGSWARDYAEMVR